MTYENKNAPPEANLREIEQALRDGGNKDFGVRQLPNCTTGSLAEYAWIDETLCPAVLEMIADSISQRTGAS